MYIWRVPDHTCSPLNEYPLEPRHLLECVCDFCVGSAPLPGAPKCLSHVLTYSLTYHNHFHGTSVPVIRDASYFQSQPECPPRVWYSPEIDTSKFTLYILSDTPGGSQWPKYTLLMKLARLRPTSASPNLPDDGLPVHLQSCSITASKCISQLTSVWPPSVSPNSLDYGLQVYLYTRSITTSMSISKLAQSRLWSALLSSLDHNVMKWWRQKADSLSWTFCHSLHGIQRKFMRKSCPSLTSTASEWQHMKGYPVMMNHTNCLDLCTLGKSAWRTTQIGWIYKGSAKVPGMKSWKR